MIKDILRNMIYFLIQLIEKYEFRNFNPNEEDITDENIKEALLVALLACLGNAKK